MSDIDVPEIETGLDGVQRQRTHRFTQSAADTNRSTVDTALAGAMAPLTAVIDAGPLPNGPAVDAALAALQTALATADLPGGTLTTAQLSNAARQTQAAVKALATLLPPAITAIRRIDTAQRVLARAIRRAIRWLRGDFEGSD